MADEKYEKKILIAAMCMNFMCLTALVLASWTFFSPKVDTGEFEALRARVLGGSYMYGDSTYVVEYYRSLEGRVDENRNASAFNAQVTAYLQGTLDTVSSVVSKHKMAIASQETLLAQTKSDIRKLSERISATNRKVTSVAKNVDSLSTRLSEIEAARRILYQARQDSARETATDPFLIGIYEARVVFTPNPASK